MAAAVEQHHDADGPVWPAQIAPFEVVVIPAGREEQHRQAADDIYAELLSAGADALLDDRDERPGVKFKEADLLGIPVQIVVGKGLTDGVVELSVRSDKANKEAVPVREAVAAACAHLTRLKG